MTIQRNDRIIDSRIIFDSLGIRNQHPGFQSIMILSSMILPSRVFWNGKRWQSYLWQNHFRLVEVQAIPRPAPSATICAHLRLIIPLSRHEEV